MLEVTSVHRNKVTNGQFMVTFEGVLMGARNSIALPKE
jgi:hypothetical protein